MNAYELLTVISLMTGGAYMHDNGYIDTGIGAHSKYFDNPEVKLDSSVFEIETGLEFKNVKVFFRHNSGILTDEIGAGFNLVGIKYRLK